MGNLCQAQAIEHQPGFKYGRRPISAIIKSGQSIKIVVAGDSNVGKTSLINKYAHDFIFERKDSEPTPGVDIWRGTN